MGQGKQAGKHRRVSWVVVSVGLAVCFSWASAGVLDPPPRLVLLLVVDQARYDYLERFAPVLDGGLKWLWEQGVVFSDAHQAHAVTVTGPGHAAISTGRYPRFSGIVGNEWFDRQRGKTVNCVEDPESPLLRSATLESASSSRSSGRSPALLLTSSLGDWIKARDPRSKVFGASRKDRGAILLAGKAADGAFWYDSSRGEFISSRYYYQELPAWVERFNAEKYPDRYFGTAWEALPFPSDRWSRLDIQPADRGWFASSFPHALGGPVPFPDSSFYSDFGASPLGDAYLLSFARRLIEEEGLGVDDSVDLLGLSFSSLDSVGHSYGPHSLEVFDCVRRLDRVLADLFRFLDQKIGLDRVLIAFSSDHGVVPLPELRQRRQQGGQRLGSQEVLCVQQVGAALEGQLGRDEWILHGSYLNYETIGRNNRKREEVEAALAGLLERCPHVERVWTRTQLEQKTPPEEWIARLYWRSFHPGRSPDFYVQPREYFLANRGSETSHGSPYRYDTHVPVILWHAALQPDRVTEPTATVDLVPTLATLLGLAAPQDRDGVDRSGELKRRVLSRR